MKTKFLWLLPAVVGVFLLRLTLGADPELQRTEFLSGLEDPWEIAFTPDGAVLFTEKCRGLSVRRADGTIARLFGSEGAAVVDENFFL